MKYHWKSEGKVTRGGQTPKITTKVATQKDEIKLIWRAYQGLIVAALLLWAMKG